MVGYEATPWDYTILNENEQEVYVRNINWSPWADKYGEPGLSTNVFEVFCQPMNAEFSEPL